jgi:hypothetical protein
VNISIAEVTSYSGNKILPQFINKNLILQYKSKSNLRWPIQHMPSKSTFTLWVNYILFITCSDKLGNVKYCLGPWEQNIDQYININSWMHTSQNHLLIQTSTNSWHKHILLHDTHSTDIYEGAKTKEKVLYTNYVPVDIEICQHGQMNVKPRLIQAFKPIQK